MYESLNQSAMVVAKLMLSIKKDTRVLFDKENLLCQLDLGSISMLNAFLKEQI